MSPDSPTARNPMNLPWKWVAGLVIALILGVGFRLVWPNDIEYKQDEIYTFTKTKNFVDGKTANLSDDGSSPWLGMPTSKGFKNTGMSLWVFYAIGCVSGAGTPPALARGVQVCNVAAIFLLLIFAWRCLKGREREWWLWAAAMICVNSFAVIFERKIWPPCALPLMMVVFLMGWRCRSARWGACCWGLLGALAGQIHMAGFIYAAAFFLWTVLYDRRRVAWGWWFGGSVAGSVPMLPWMYYMATAARHGSGGAPAGAAFLAWWRPFANHFWLDWVSEPFGLGLEYSLGKDYSDFIRSPVVGGHATYATALLLGISLMLCIGMLAAGFMRWWKNRARLREIWRNDQAMFTPSVLQAGFWFFGVILTVSCIRFERHYLIVAFPLIMLWVARLALPIDATERQWSSGRRFLTALCITNALITFLLLDYIHVNGGAPDGGFYKSYGKQLQDGLPAAQP